MAARGKRLGGLAARIGAAVLALAAAVAAAEALVRATDPFGASYYRDVGRYFSEAIVLPPEAARPDGRVFENAPAVELELATFRFATDGLGLRAPRATSAAPAAGGAARTLLFLGDSVTLGWGVDDERTWVRLLEARARGPEGAPVRCLNAGHLRYDTVQEADWLRAHGLALAPDAVVLTFVGNDLEDHWAQYLEIRAALEERARPSLVGRVAAHLRLRLRGLHGLWVHHVVTRELARDAEGAPARIADDPELVAGWERARAALARIADRCEAAGAALVVLDHTGGHLPELRRWCEEREVPWAAFDFTAEERALDLRNSLADAHANERGNELLAAKAHAALAAAGVLAPPGPER